MAYEAEDDDLDVEIYEELITYSKTFEEHAWKVCNVFFNTSTCQTLYGMFDIFQITARKKNIYEGWKVKKLQALMLMLVWWYARPC